MSKRIGIIGAGAAGLFAAGIAGAAGKSALVFEKNKKPGRKLLITGKGRCNITNNCSMEELMSNIPGNGRFLYSAFNKFNNLDIMAFFESINVPVKTERGNRVFPVSDRSMDVVNALVNYAKSNGAKFLFESPVAEICCVNGQVRGVKLKNNDYYELDSVILATGGLSYPMTGSEGDGYRMAKALGHTVTELKPSLVPLETVEKWVPDLQGLTLKNVGLTAFDNKGNKVYHEQGEMLFTHFGVSGPMILSASRHIMDCGYKGAYFIIDLKPALDEEKLDLRLQRDFAKYSRKQFGNSLSDLLPKSLIPVFVELSGIPSEKPVNQITRTERKELVKLFKGLKVTVSKPRPIQEAIITAGGISTKEINPSTMESKLIKGLYFAGEIIDVDAYTGGFNLTIAFSTAYAAAMNA
ncbi:MAG TPA: NAD(P)/FAD-dependent oxidoreductase [Clostridiaceae bacterium]|nr:NAD(P)/FAD-dependent oxidoreductase [Clostridiaceae bacterium]